MFMIYIYGGQPVMYVCIMLIINTQTIKQIDIYFFLIVFTVLYI